MSWLVLDDAGIWQSEEVPLDEDEYLVIVSHDCDIERLPDREPWVEALGAHWTHDKDTIRNASRRNSIRGFLLARRTAADKTEEGLVADPVVRVQIDKRALLVLSPVDSLQDRDPATFLRFREWLGRRYNRPALEKAIEDAVQRPIVEAIGKLKTTHEIHGILDGVSEVRFVLRNQAAPYEVELLFMRQEDGSAPPVADEDAATLAAWMDSVLCSRGKAKLEDWNVHSLATISVLDYITAQPLSLEQFSSAETGPPVETTQLVPGAPVEGQ
jgi:hypothetical protein